MRGKHTVTVHGAPRGRKTLHTVGYGLVPKGIVNDTALYPSAMQPSARYLPPWLGETRALLASVYRSNPQESIRSTHVTASHVTQGRVKYEFT
jgi:hypothetical protein